MPKVPLNTITSGYGTVDALNQNFDAIEAAFDNTLSRDGDTPNEMQANLDMNGYEVLNVGSLNGVPVADLSDISGYVDTALAAATSASASATNAANTYDLFDDRYLGSKTSNPTVDNDGNALQVGAEYWNSVSNERRTWTGSAWVSSITVVPDGSVTPIKLSTGAPTWDTSGNLRVTASTGGIGYGTGAGGTVTQATSKSTAVTLNRPAGRITMNNGLLSAGSSVEFTLTNNTIAASDCLLVNLDGPSLFYRVEVARQPGGSPTIRLTNITGIGLSEAVVINFAIIKGAIS